MKERAAGRRPYPSDVSDDEWAFVAPYLTLMDPEAPQREHSLRDLFNAVRWIVRSGAPRRYMPSEFPPWAAVYQQMRRWMAAGVFEQMVHGGVDICLAVAFPSPAAGLRTAARDAGGVSFRGLLGADAQSPRPGTGPPQ